VKFSIRKRLILDGIDFDIPKGCVFAIVGHNGAGKTTLFHLLLGLKFQTAGTITLFGKSNLDHHARKSLGYVPERPYLNLEYSFREFLVYHANLMGISFSKKPDEILLAAKSVSLEAHLDHDLSTFSKGMLQKALLAQAMLGNPELLILDEPMSGLDPEAREMVRTQISALKARGKTLIFSSHALDDVELLADQVLILKDGKVQFLGAVAAWKESR
jgi:ABC-2 type transport system ATP-binding protein